ncbi:MAG: Hsp33 family molecular chaperone HslO [Firmicutes bacterium]|nr:Hsp33 family molecular chaperone HslO [Bacillota bacterium]
MDRIERAVGVDLPIRVLAAETTDLVEHARKVHETLPTATAALGRVLTGTALFGAILKGKEDEVTVQISGSGPVGTLLATADAKGNVRGYIQNPQVHLELNSKGKLDVGGAVGTDGFLNVIKDLGVGQGYQSKVPLVTGEIGDDFTYYFTQSEQVPSAVGLGVLVERDGSVGKAGGFLLQLMPGADEATVTKAEEMVARVPSVTGFYTSGGTAKTMIETFFGSDVQFKWLESLPVTYTCSCSRERLAKALVSLGAEELNSLAADENGAELVCRFCWSKYHFTPEELRELAKSAGGGR